MNSIYLNSQTPVPKSGDIYKDDKGQYYILCETGQSWFLCNLKTGKLYTEPTSDINKATEHMKGTQGEPDTYIEHLGGEFEITLKKL